MEKITMKKILGKIIFVVLIIFIILETIVLFESKKNPEKTAGVFGIKVFCIISGSMEPTIKTNDIILVKEVNKDDFKVGDIITFNKDGETITHRIDNIIRDENGKMYFRTKGDATGVQDTEKVFFDDIEGKYIFRIPFLGKLISALQSEFVIMFIIAILIIYYLMAQAINRKKKRRSQVRMEYEKEQREKNSTLGE